jgi:hypothetical protein
MTLEEEKHQMDIGEKEEEVYSEAGLEDLSGEEDELTDADEGFMKGYIEGAKTAKCVSCGAVLTDDHDIVEIEHNDQTYRFCGTECAEKYKENFNDNL